MLVVRWPLIDIATCWETPLRIMSRTAVRRRSWKIFPGTLAFPQAARHAFVKLPSGRPWRWNTNADSVGSPGLDSNSRACQRRSMRAASSPSSGRARPSPFFDVVSRTSPAARSTSSHRSPRISPRRQPLRYANLTSSSRDMGRLRTTTSNSARSKKPCRAFLSGSAGNFGRYASLPSSTANRKARARSSGLPIDLGVRQPSLLPLGDVGADTVRRDLHGADAPKMVAGGFHLPALPIAADRLHEGLDLPLAVVD